jgi:hypothetical protein
MLAIVKLKPWTAKIDPATINALVQDDVLENALHLRGG